MLVKNIVDLYLNNHEIIFKNKLYQFFTLVYLSSSQNWLYSFLWLALFTFSSRQDSTDNEIEIKVKIGAVLPGRECKQSEPQKSVKSILGRSVGQVEEARKCSYSAGPEMAISYQLFRTNGSPNSEVWHIDRSNICLSLTLETMERQCISLLQNFNSMRLNE